MKVFVVVGGQFGSEAKGHVAAQLAARELAMGQTVCAVRVAGPNAGHTAYDPLGRSFALRTIPVMAVVDPSVQLVLAAGSEIDPIVLLDEIELLEASGIPVWDRLTVDGQATVLMPEHIEEETGATMHERLGSTGKGVGAARAARLMRRAMTWEQYINHPDAISGQLHYLGYGDTANWLSRQSADVSLILEGTQGFGLGLHAGFYPFCTSSDCRAIDFLAMAGIDPRDSNIQVCRSVVVFRTFPIRVAGNSGPLFSECSWDELAEESNGHIQPERTTVTKKIRRVGRWDSELAHDAVWANGGPGVVDVALTFADYIDPVVAGAEQENLLTPDVRDFLGRVTQDTSIFPFLVTTGPNTAIWL